MFLNNIKSAENWNVLRNRFWWGAPIPIWKMKYEEPPKEVLKHIDKDKIDILKLYTIGNNSAMYYNFKSKELQAVFGSIEDLECFFRDDYVVDFLNGKNSDKYLHFKLNYTKEDLQQAVEKYGYENVFINNFLDFHINDLHRPFIDELVKHLTTGELKRTEEVLDCWFESGSMPFAQVHYPSEYRDGNGNLIRTAEENKKITHAFSLPTSARQLIFLLIVKKSG